MSDYCEPCRLLNSWPINRSGSGTCFVCKGVAALHVNDLTREQLENVLPGLSYFHIVEYTHMMKGDALPISIEHDWPGDSPAEAVEGCLNERLGDGELEPGDRVDVLVRDHGTFRFHVAVSLVNETPPNQWERVLAEPRGEPASLQLGDFVQKPGNGATAWLRGLLGAIEKQVMQALERVAQHDLVLNPSNFTDLEVTVNWCPAVGTTLGDDEVVDGKYIETGDPVMRQTMTVTMKAEPLPPATEFRASAAAYKVTAIPTQENLEKLLAPLSHKAVAEIAEKLVVDPDHMPKTNWRGSSRGFCVEHLWYWVLQGPGSWTFDDERPIEGLQLRLSTLVDLVEDRLDA